MTDNEIVKALENEVHFAKYIDSNYCGAVDKALIQSAVSLINRLQAEIEWLKHCKFDAVVKARKDLADNIIAEIESAIQSNIDAIEERIEKGHRDIGFENRCTGKIVAMHGIRDFIEEELEK